MKIAIYGVGAIGSTFALHLARRGHEVTAIARNQRLAELQADKAIVTLKGGRAPVTVSDKLDPSIEYDLVLVTVLATGVDAIMPALQASRARAVMFMFNTFASIEPLRQAVGAERFSFGFPGIAAFLGEGKLESQILERGQPTSTTDPRWARVFTEAGIYTVVERDMQSWLRTHAVVISAISAATLLARARHAGISLAEARPYALAMHEGFALVRDSGNAITPSAIALLQRAPVGVASGLLWALSRVKAVRDFPGVGPAEPRALIDAMVAAAPERTRLLKAIRP